MGRNSEIGWTDDTFNPWWGCTKVSPGCAFCYAEGISNRWKGKKHGKTWGDDAVRVPASEAAWKEPEKWNRQAIRDGNRRRVFTGSMCDVMEVRNDTMELQERLWKLIEATPRLTWLLLTKRPEHADATPWTQWDPVAPESPCEGNTDRSWPDHVWLGTSVESREHIERITVVDEARGCAARQFVSMEPLLERVILRPHDMVNLGHVIIGGESGPKARPMELAWAASLIGQCHDAGVPCYVKQLGTVIAKRYGYKDSQGRDPKEWPAFMRVRQLPQPRGIHWKRKK